MNRCNFAIFCILTAFLHAEHIQETLATSRTNNGGKCTAQMYGTFRIAVQYCDGSNWLTMQPCQNRHANSDANKSSGKPHGVSGTSCNDILKKGLSKGDGKYLIDPDGRGKAISVYCDMSSFGGGWTMCYTTGSHVDIKTELTSKPSTGYRADCNNIPFTEVIFVDEKSKEKAAFKKSGLAVKFSGNYNKKADAYDLWTAKGVPSTKFKYQMLVCDTSFYKGLHFSGYTNCYKKCDNWCGDTSSPYFRTSAAKKQGYSGVAFNENGHKEVKNRLISAGIR